MKLRSGKYCRHYYHCFSFSTSYLPLLSAPARANRTVSMLGQPLSQLPKSLTIRLNARRRNKQWHNNSKRIEKLSIPMSAVCRDNLMHEYEQHERQFNPGGRLPIPASDLDTQVIAYALACSLWEYHRDTFREPVKSNGELTAWFEWRKEAAYQRSRAQSVKNRGYGWKG
ncbi:hypothetical protein FPQ18DRAFT_306042 [Pyronema domesticum]|uniref:Uncharacterized protein n=1 Tax=Pyronema omphalodes (strain CBS 100304) TaxID=1076935 RepID=U4L510_PYROM|nr:hypothetical protein FPQ18DRAFT_306042 [Pyronema domesticum]CCX11703.1 Protein of unknown function [Pyronema omphalodes CBS 100304]